nr:Methylated-DNA--protein-cysteine methyltransferase [Paraburkholderia busanensis]
MTYAYKLMDSPVGQLKLVARGERLAAILWEHDKPNRVRLDAMVEENDRPILLDTERQLNEYFAGRRQAFDLALDFQGTEFQKKVWHALLTIPFGQTRSYSEIAVQVGNVNAVRAVGAANGRNPISIVAPCHRVIGASGELTGFAGGLANKMLLLSLEAGQTSLEAAADDAGARPSNATAAARDAAVVLKGEKNADVAKADGKGAGDERTRAKATRPAPDHDAQGSLFGN